MSAINVVIEEAGVARRIQDLRGRFASPKPVLSGPVLNYIDAALRQNFLTHGEWARRQWAELRPSTVRKKTKAGRLSFGILRYNDTLFKAVALPYGVSRLKQYDVTEKSLHLRILDPVAKRHQEGTPRMVERQVVPNPMPQSFVDGLRNIVRRFLIDATLE